MVSTTFPPPLFGCVFGAKKWHTSFQHAVKNDQHRMSHRDNRKTMPIVFMTRGEREARSSKFHPDALESRFLRQ
jgi:hypothetical protein